jgi:glycogen(starch) synthase
LAIGRLVRQKGFDILIRSLGVDGTPPWDLVIAGDGPERDALQSLARSIGVAERVSFVGAIGRAELPALLARASAFVLPSRGEPFGIALLEAMAAGIPAVATRAGGVTDFAHDGENALLVDIDDVDAVARALRRLCTDSELRARLSHAGLATAAAHSWANITPRYEALYRTIT